MKTEDLEFVTRLSVLVWITVAVILKCTGVVTCPWRSWVLVATFPLWGALAFVLLLLLAGWAKRSGPCDQGRKLT
jgi:hypothetical protein